MKHTCIIVCCALFLSSCCPRRVILNNSTIDSIRVVREVEYIEKLRDTTIYITLPAEVKEVIRQDSSFLETSAAVSLARIEPDGKLWHTLSNKQNTVPHPVKIKDTEEKTVEKEVVIQKERIEVSVKLPLTTWQKFWIYSGVVLWALVIGYIAFRIFK